MATVSPCVYKTITLSAGEDFSLPANAEVLYISDNSLVSYSCGDLPITDTTCWRFRMPMGGQDIDSSSPEFYVTGFKFDNLDITINPNYFVYGALGTCVESTNAETAQGFVDRLCYNMWYQLATVANGPTILGMTVAYVDADTSGGDILEIILHVPDVFTTAETKLLDKNSQGVTFQVDGTSGDCTNPDGTDAHRTMGIMGGA